MINNKRLKTSTKITIPILIIVIITAIINSYSIEVLLEKHIKKIYTKTLDTSTEKSYFLIKNDYKNLFYNYGKDINKFNIMQEALKNETLKKLKLQAQQELLL